MQHTCRLLQQYLLHGAWSGVPFLIIRSYNPPYWVERCLSHLSTYLLDDSDFIKFSAEFTLTKSLKIVQFLKFLEDGMCFISEIVNNTCWDGNDIPRWSTITNTDTRELAIGIDSAQKDPACRKSDIKCALTKCQSGSYEWVQRVYLCEKDSQQLVAVTFQGVTHWMGYQRALSRSDLLWAPSEYMLVGTILLNISYDLCRILINIFQCNINCSGLASIVVHLFGRNTFLDAILFCCSNEKSDESMGSIFGG